MNDHNYFLGLNDYSRDRIRQSSSSLAAESSITIVMRRTKRKSSSLFAAGGVGSNDSNGNKRIRRSAFGKAAIGKNRSLILGENIASSLKPTADDSTSMISTTSSSADSISPSVSSTRKSQQVPRPKSRKRRIQNVSIPPNSDGDIESIIERRDEALLALKTHLRIPLHESLEILNTHPSLYLELSGSSNNGHDGDETTSDPENESNENTLSSKLLYLLNDINIKPKQLRKMLLSHPRLMENVLLEEQENITNTVEILQTELNLSMDDIQNMPVPSQKTSSSLPAILSYPRSELRKRILVYKRDLLYPTEELKNMVLRDPRMLRTDSSNVRQLLKVFEEELGIGSSSISINRELHGGYSENETNHSSMKHVEEVHKMLKKEILLLTYNAEGNIRPTIRYLKESHVGKCLGMVERKGLSTLKATSQVEREEIVRERLKTLVMGHPKVLSSSVEKNLKPTVAFFLNDCGLSEYEFGRVIYRRGGSLLEANVDRTLKRKVAFLRDNLGLDLDEELKVGNETEINNDLKDEQVEIPELSTKSTRTEISNFQKKRLLAQMLATNPDILTLSIENNLQPKFDYFMNKIGFSKEELRYILLKRPQLLSLSLDRNIIPKVECFLEPRSKTCPKEGGLGMKIDEVRQWLAQYPQTLAVTFEGRLKPRVSDVVQLGLFWGDDVLPLNFLTRTERNWSQWKNDYLLQDAAIKSESQ
eukprot:CAMPEP_0203665760 /NCGR_PEP_ID=MMETSP0090-20130426/2929_1 /ASSEMBLY_ACC=CAM_ASM_001088 /TAXON_ID=426623 /ORGANISM="Chaetoceros affinis, Strain CCMP159" /LENGTH=704 /DNA_ID=CAMNT_0050529431 /DNA_START=273 /DNA_END=2387 /DNA_ORIENTATION=-